MEYFLALMTQMGISIASDSIYDLIKGIKDRGSTTEELKTKVENILELHNVTIHADTVIEALAENGFIFIANARIHANQSMKTGSLRGSSTITNSTLTTNCTSIQAGPGAAIKTQGHSYLHQDSDGSIKFMVGKGDGNSMVLSSGIQAGGAILKKK